MILLLFYKNLYPLSPKTKELFRKLKVEAEAKLSKVQIGYELGLQKLSDNRNQLENKYHKLEILLERLPDVKDIEEQAFYLGMFRKELERIKKEHLESYKGKPFSVTINIQQAIDKGLYLTKNTQSEIWPLLGVRRVL
ncbi:hypothetical protein ACFQZR_19650 [Paenibacillus sp. GCM10027629]|uniref:hypothetical protein n=1 Tax=Paenibacillus sp. GCM10027629 TaxID=3273414 RepID=UPI00363A166D